MRDLVVTVFALSASSGAVDATTVASTAPVCSGTITGLGLPPLAVSDGLLVGRDVDAAVRGSSFGRKAELISPIPTKKSSVEK